MKNSTIIKPKKFVLKSKKSLDKFSKEFIINQNEEFTKKLKWAQTQTINYSK